MKRIPALQPLSMEHHLSLSLAVKAMRTARSGDDTAIRALCGQIVADYPGLWRPHFDAEERCLFRPFSSLSPEIGKLCEQLEAEHRQFDRWVDAMRSGDSSVLEAFGELLQSHTRLEERVLFGLIEKELTQPQQERLESCLGSSRA